jgi:hypothetical protein
MILSSDGREFVAKKATHDEIRKKRIGINLGVHKKEKLADVLKRIWVM